MQRARLAVLMAAVALTASLPLAGALAGPAGGDATPEAVRPEAARPEAARDEAVRDGSGTRDTARTPADQAPAVGAPGDGKQGEGRPGRPPAGPGAEGNGSGLLSGLGLTTAAQCGPELASPGGVEAQTCVLAQSGDIWARTYYRNATGGRLSSVLTLMGPGGRTVQMHCAVGADDEPGACETPREPARGAASDYSAIAEFAASRGDRGEQEERPLLLRSGSNSARTPGS